MDQGGVVEQAAQVPEPLEPALGLVRVAPQASGLGGAAPAAQQLVGTQPVEQRLGIGDVVVRRAAGVAERVREGDEELLGLGGLHHRLASHRSIHGHRVTSIPRLTSYFVPGTLFM